MVTGQDVEEVWFGGLHSEVGGMLDRGAVWDLLGGKHRVIPSGARVRASVGMRLAADPGYRQRARIPDRVEVVDPSWLTSVADT